MPTSGPVRVRLHVEIPTYSGASTYTDIEIPRGEWDAMTADERCAYLDDALQTARDNHVSTGWEMLSGDPDPDDED